jgi:hypothetical protein
MGAFARAVIVTHGSTDASEAYTVNGACSCSAGRTLAAQEQHTRCSNKTFKHNSRFILIGNLRHAQGANGKSSDSCLHTRQLQKRRRCS